MTVYKANLNVTVLFQADSLGHAHEIMLATDLADVAHEISEGEWIGMTRMESVSKVDAERTLVELQAIGNDGTFFNTEE